MNNGRWVSYIYRFREGRRCENAGFVKVQRTGCGDKSQARIQIGIKLYKNKPCKCATYLIYNGKKIDYLTDICIQSKERDTIIKRVQLPWDNPLGKNRSVSEYDGVIFVCDDGEFLAGMWREYEISPDDIVQDNTDSYTNSVVEIENNNQDEEIPDVAVTENENYILAEKDIEDIDAKDFASEESSTDPCQHMLDTHPKLPVFMDSQLIECVKIVPHDIGMLPMANWKLGVNSFLSHGYYHYRYIMMGRVSFDNQEIYVIGVPGVFTNKEKYLANMFGFNIFVPVKRTDTMTGNFGYWISEIVRE